MTKKNAKKSNYNLTVKLSMKKESGVKVEVSTWCADWENMQKFISQFENNLLAGDNGNPQNQDRR